ncbi:MAG: amidohydrolase family protein, partial [Allosphingosinicella sp.]
VPLIAALACVLSLLISAAVRADSPWLAIVGGTVIDGTGAAPRPNTTVLIDGERIIAVGPRASVDVPTDARIVDATDKWVIPGLIDAHIHFFQSGGLYTRPDIIDLRDVVPYKEEIERVREQLPQTFARYIASGVTSVIDAGGPFWTFDVRSLAERIPRAPRVALAGPLLASAPPAPLQALDDPPMLAVSTREGAYEAVDRLLPYEPDMIKIWLVQTNRALEEEMAWVGATIAASKVADVPVLVHATRLAYARAVVAAGADILAHSITDRPVDDALLDAMKANDVVYTTSLVVDERYRQVFNGQISLLDIERRLGDPATIESLVRPDTLPLGLSTANWALPEPPPGPDRTAAENLRRVQAHEITIAAGSDAGNIGTLHGPALHRELELLVEAGLTPMQALLAATRGGAIAMHRLGDLGSLKAGMLADLVVLDADPLADISNTQNIARVVKNGIVFDPDEIAQELRQNKQQG